MSQDRGRPEARRAREIVSEKESYEALVDEMKLLAGDENHRGTVEGNAAVFLLGARASSTGRTCSAACIVAVGLLCNRRTRYCKESVPVYTVESQTGFAGCMARGGGRWSEIGQGTALRAAGGPFGGASSCG